ncbi:HECT-domain-containing protein [Apiospora rasikravindrae]|uniref:HECT-type E3 ubiquitin transferase n=1 Tax=Apiospora rasikravindrae TaxID=990691 RepID=A0ABR1TEG7_9PEZI
MFGNFTGQSKRPRNVNLSGQRNNPWATPGSAWGSSTGASKTVAQAQAEREKRQRERDELAASRKLQRVWRGHHARRSTKNEHRRQWDQLYHNTESVDVPMSDGDAVADPERAREALPLLLSLFDPSLSEDQRRLDQFLLDASSEAWKPQGHQYKRLASLLVTALEKRPSKLSQRPFALLVRLVVEEPRSIAAIEDRYYKLLASYCENAANDMDHSGQEVLAEAVTAPLDNRKPRYPEAYTTFAYSFLTCSDIAAFLQWKPDAIAQRLDLETLSRTIISGSRAEVSGQRSKDQLLWLLAHFIALNRALSTVQGSVYLEALYQQLCPLIDDIRIRSAPQPAEDEADSSDDEDESAIRKANPLPAYVLHQLEFLVNENGISELLSRFTSTASSSARLSEDASILAGYTLLLLRCFPAQRDDMRMRLFQGDIRTQGPAGSVYLPSVKFLWLAVSKTEVFTTISQPKKKIPSSTIVSLLRSDPARDQEWRIVLLFLELYNFLLRVTDDDDFLVDERDVIVKQSPAVRRIRASGLSISELELLVTFLKNLSFTLYHNLKDVMPRHRSRPALGALLGVSSATTTRDIPEQVDAPSFAGILGLDPLSLRGCATTTMQSLYERDSRRSFLPSGFWLMTSKFDMEGFISAVVLEEQQSQNAEDDAEMSDSDINPLDNHTSAGQRLSRAAQIERQRQLQRVHKEQLLSQLGPKLEILRNMPFAIPFDVRVKIFRQFVDIDKIKRRNGLVDPDQWRLGLLNGALGGPHQTGRDVLGRHTARIKRGQLFSDAYDQFYALGEGLKEPIQITFVDQFDQPEAGIDGGGVTKEFLTSVSSEAFKPGDEGPRLFVTNSQNLLHPNPAAFDELSEDLTSIGIPKSDWVPRITELTQQYEFLGRIVGKCMYEGILVDIAFAPFFLLRWPTAGQSTSDFRSSLNDLRDLDPDLYKGLMSLKNYSGDVSDLSLDFTITDQVTNPRTGQSKNIVRLLRKDGDKTIVTNTDRVLYISYVAHHRLVAQSLRQTKAFLRGLSTIINPSWLSMFNQSELQRLVGGDSTEIDIVDLRNNTQYSGVYSIGDDGEEHETVKMFWDVMKELADTERRALLKYVTSTPRAPLLGFSQLSPRFSIRDGGDDETRLPSTSTCVNLLKLPRYKDAKTLKKKLLYAIQSGAGFDLS